MILSRGRQTGDDDGAIGADVTARGITHYLLFVRRDRDEKIDEVIIDEIWIERHAEQAAFAIGVDHRLGHQRGREQRASRSAALEPVLDDVTRPAFLGEE